MACGSSSANPLPMESKMANPRKRCPTARLRSRLVRGATHPSRNREGAAPLLALAAVLLALPLAGGAGPKDAGDAGTVPQRVQAELAAAHRARSRLAEEKQAWAREKERLELLVSAVRRRAERLHAEAERDRAARKDLKNKVDALSAKRERLQAVEALLDALAERLEKDLQTLAEASLPGLVPPDTAAGVTDPARRLDAAVARLEETEARLGTATVEIVTGVLNGREVTVKLLRTGNAAAWWTSLDGGRAGTARREGERLVLAPTDSPEAARAIRKAVAVAEGRAAPDWAVLPAEHLDLKK